MSRSDAHILAAVRAGDAAAFSELAERHAPRIYRLALSALGDATEAEDVTQETLIQAYRCAGRFNGSTNAGPWLLGIAANRCRMWARGKGPSAVPLEALAHTPDGSAGDAQTSPGDTRAQLRLDI
jgi:RNA polymerase sigma-70 factor (ECF subfamily)